MRMGPYDPDTMEEVGTAVAMGVLSFWGCLARTTEKGTAYGRHLCRAWGMAGYMAYGSLCWFLHGVIPFEWKVKKEGTVKKEGKVKKEKMV